MCVLSTAGAGGAVSIPEYIVTLIWRILVAMGYKSFEQRRIVPLLLGYYSNVSPISRYVLVQTAEIIA